VPLSWRLIGYLCLGLPEREDDAPALERAGWEQRRASPETVLLRR
jgi:5,6-dimethylbenzimidazole synthase